MKQNDNIFQLNTQYGRKIKINTWNYKQLYFNISKLGEIKEKHFYSLNYFVNIHLYFIF